MSNRTYNQLWLKTQSEIEKVLVSETQVLIGRAEKDRELAYKAVSKLYLQYVKIFRTLDTCLDQMVHPQKRILLRKLLDSTIGRILELKHDLVNLDSLEYSYHDVTMAELGLHPAEVELHVPKYVITEREKEIQYWKNELAEAKEKMEAEGELDSGPKLTVDEATAMLQKHERARQGRLRAKLMQEIRTQEKKVASIVEKSANKNTTETMAARRIQAHWRGVVARKKVKKKREDELVFIGMIPPPEYPRAYQDRLKIMEEQRRELQAKHEEEYQKALDEIKDDIREKEGDDIIENMKEDIRQWFNTEKDETGKFPDYPSDEEGGSGAVFHPELQSECSENVGEEDEVGMGPGKKEPKKGADDKKGEIEEDESTGFKLGQSEFVKGLKAADKTFQGVY